MNNTLTAINGLRVGHWTSADNTSGCTAILCPKDGCVASGYALGGAPATRESALLAPEKTVERIHGVLLSGGSAFGLAAASGVMRYLEEQGHGFETRAGNVPIVPAACIYDLEVSRPESRPDETSGYLAAQAASCEPVQTGRIGAGAGASAGAYLGFEQASPSGLGSATVTFEGGTIAALSVANPAGDIYDPDTHTLIAGQGLKAEHIAPLLLGYKPQENTTLVVVATDITLSKAQAHALTMSAHIGIAHVTRPSHTIFDGDMAFVLSTGTGPTVPLGPLCVLVQDVVAKAIVQGARAAQPPQPQ